MLKQAPQQSSRLSQQRHSVPLAVNVPVALIPHDHPEMVKP